MFMGDEKKVEHNGARYLIATKYKKDGTPLKRQPADVFRRMLKVQKIPFDERMIQVVPKELKNICWDRPQYKLCVRTRQNIPDKTFRECTNLEINTEMATEFTFNNQGKL